MVVVEGGFLCTELRGGGVVEEKLGRPRREG
jgi:hypothetical protein